MLVHDFTVKPSKYYLGCIIIVLLFATGVVLWMPAENGMKFLCLLAVMGYGGYIVRQDCLLRGKNSIYSLHYHAATGWRIKTRDNVYGGIQIAGDSVVTSLVIVLRVKVDKWRKLSCVIFPDALPTGLFRQLTVWLRNG